MRLGANHATSKSSIRAPGNTHIKISVPILRRIWPLLVLPGTLIFSYSCPFWLFLHIEYSASVGKSAFQIMVYAFTFWDAELLRGIADPNTCSHLHLCSLSKLKFSTTQSFMPWSLHRLTRAVSPTPQRGSGQRSGSWLGFLRVYSALLYPFSDL